MALTRLGLNQAINLATNATGTLPVANGGTGLSSGFINGTTNVGKVLQVVTASKTGTNQATTSSSFTDVTNLTCTITPSSASNYLFVTAQVQYQVYGNNSTDSPEGQILLQDTSNNEFVEQNFYEYSSANNYYHLHSAYFQHYYTPNSTSAITFKLRMKAESGRFQVIAEDDTKTKKPTSLIVMEVSA